MNVIEFITTCKFRSLTVKAPLMQTPYQQAPPLSILSILTHDLMKNMARSQMANSQKLLSEIVLLIKILVFKVCQNLSS